MLYIIYVIKINTLIKYTYTVTRQIRLDNCAHRQMSERICRNAIVRVPHTLIKKDFVKRIVLKVC